MNVDALTGLHAAQFGIYVHFPYCLAKCPYCDFASFAERAIPQERYTRAILGELSLRCEDIDARVPVESVYFGGGTPSLWDATQVETVLVALRSRFSFSHDCEVTLEANPGASEVERFAAYRVAGVNRLSIGVQSFDPLTLKALGRAHGGEEAVRAVRAARTAGYENISLDFIFGVPGQTVASARADAIAACALAPEHLSAYALTLDTDSLAVDVPLGVVVRSGKMTLPPDSEIVAMQRAVAEVYAEHGYERYEVSNYAHSGRHSRHNGLYWTGGEYLALGVGATGTLRSRGAGTEGVLRYSNFRTLEAYLTSVEAGKLPQAESEHLAPGDLFVERLSLGLRLVGGLDVGMTCERFGQAYPPRATMLAELKRQELAFEREGRWALTPRGFDLHSEIAVRLM